MNESQHMWDPEWASNINEKINLIGFNSISELLKDMVGQSYAAVAERLGNTAPIQVIALQFREARINGNLREAAKDSLVRNLVEKLPNGWGIGVDADWKSVLALSSWTSEIEVTGGCEELEPILLSIAQAIRKLPPPEGWCPNSPNDPIIKRVFDSQWN